MASLITSLTTRALSALAGAEIREDARTVLRELAAAETEGTV